MSQNELKLVLQEALQPGTLVQASAGTRIIMAQVRPCVAHGQQFLVSVEIKNVFFIPGKNA